MKVRAKQDGEYRGPRKKGAEFAFLGTVDKDHPLPHWMEPLEAPAAPPEGEKKPKK